MKLAKQGVGMLESCTGSTFQILVGKPFKSHVANLSSNVVFKSIPNDLVVLFL